MRLFVREKINEQIKIIKFWIVQNDGEIELLRQNLSFGDRFCRKGCFMQSCDLLTNAMVVCYDGCANA